MSSLAPFLPSRLLELLSRGRVRQRKTLAALLFADISGFTALTEKLAASGRGGAEEIARVINRVFRPAIRAIADHGGSVVSFGGDALFAMFPGGGSVGRAAATAEAIRAFVTKKGTISTSRGPVRLAVSQAIHFGKVSELGLIAGDRSHYLVAGPSVQALARLETKAVAGEIALSRAARERRSGERRPQKPCPGSRAPAAAKLDAALVASYLDPRLETAVRGFKGAFRRAACLFLETKGSSKAALDAWFAALCDVLDRYDGMLLKSDLSPSGTKWICLFGVPKAHENDPDRAARAALELPAAAPPGLMLRGGLHAGTVANVVIGTGFRKCFDVMGDAVNTAARAMGRAAFGEVLVTEGCRNRLTGIATEDRGRHAVKGKKEPLHLHALARVEAFTKALHVSAPMIGRDGELATLVEALGKARKGRGSVIGIKGEAGMGKSRLKYEASKKADEMGFAVHEGRAVTFRGMPYFAIGSLVKDALGLPETPPKEEVLSRVADVAGELGLKNVDRHYLAEVLGARYAKSPIEQLDAKAARLNNNLAVKALFAALAARKPRLLVLEDLHWADGGSIEAVQWLAKAAVESAMLVLLLYRPGYELPSQAREILLSELPAASVDELLEAHLGAVPEAVGRLVKERAGGNPFYIEELVRHLLETGVLGMSDTGYELTREILTDDIPPGIESLIAARLDRLSRGARDVAQHASVIGRSFLLTVLKRLRAVARKVEPGVAELLSREVIFRKAEEPPEYIFKHAMTRDVAYAGMLVSHRRRVHRSVAEAIEQIFASDRENYLAMLGHHWEQAGRTKKAGVCYLAGARTAVKRYAHEEAEGGYRAYLRLVKEPTEESIRARNELGGNVLQLRGRMPEAEEEHRRALAGARQIRSRTLEGESLRQVGWTCCVSGRMEEARGLCEQALEIAREVGDRSLEASTLGNLASLEGDQGRMEEAQALYVQALKIGRDVGNRRGEVITHGNLALLQMRRGRMEEARRLYLRAIKIAHEVGDRRLEGVWLGSLANLHRRQGRMEEARQHYLQALEIAREVGDRSSEGIDLGNLANLRYEQGQIEEARQHYLQALALCHEVGDRRSEGVGLGNLAGLHQEEGRMEEARRLYLKALAIAREMGDRRREGIWLGSLANLESDQDRIGKARRLYLKALAIAREVGDRRTEGIDFGSLANLHYKQGRMEEARGLYLQALEITREVGDRGQEGIALGDLASLDKDQGRMEEARGRYEQALGIAREVGNRRFEGVLLSNLAAWVLLATGDSNEAKEHSGKGEALLREVHDKLEIASLLCTRGHIRLAGRDVATDLLREAEGLATDLATSADSELGKDLAKLRRAQAAFDAGKPLVCGYVREDLTEGQLRWLSKHRPEVFQERGAKGSA